MVVDVDEYDVLVSECVIFVDGLMVLIEVEVVVVDLDYDGMFGVVVGWWCLDVEEEVVFVCWW